jgi:hypothetical protein
MLEGLQALSSAEISYGSSLGFTIVGEAKSWRNYSLIELTSLELLTNSRSKVTWVWKCHLEIVSIWSYSEVALHFRQATKFGRAVILERWEVLGGAAMFGRVVEISRAVDVIGALEDEGVPEDEWMLEDEGTLWI